MDMFFFNRVFNGCIKCTGIVVLVKNCGSVLYAAWEKIDVLVKYITSFYRFSLRMIKSCFIEMVIIISDHVHLSKQKLGGQKLMNYFSEVTFV